MSLSAVISVETFSASSVTIQLDSYPELAQEHNLYRSQSSEGNPVDNGVLIGSYINPDEKFIDNDVSPNTTYYYQLESLFYTPVETELSTDGEANYEVVTSSSANSIQYAGILADKLGQITGATFNTATGRSGQTDIWVGTFEELLAVNPQLDYSHRLSTNIDRLDEFIIETHAFGVRIVGAGATGVRNGVWWFLRQLGYRYFFPWETWEHIPDLPTAKVAIKTHQKPSFLSRRTPSNASWTDDPSWDEWRRRNMGSYAFSVSTGHAWGSIISRNQAEFDAHPEWTIGAETTGSKFRVSEQGLRDLVIQDALNRMIENPSLNSISMDPTDGSGWPTDEAEVNFKPPEEGYEEYDGDHISDRVVYLANLVAKAINDWSAANGHGPKFVGIYAYNQHSMSPNIQVHPNVVVSIATSYTQVPASVNIPAWGQKAQRLGLREFLVTFVGNQGVIRAGRGANVTSMINWFKFSHENGVRFSVGSTTDTWGGHGLPHYLITQMQWDINIDAEEVIEDFYQKAYGEAYTPMKEFHEFINRGSDRPRTRSDLLHNCYTILRGALGIATDPKVRARIEDCILYVRYVDLHWRVGSQENAAEAWKHAYRMVSRGHTPMVQLYRYYRRSTFLPQVNPPPEVSMNSYTVGQTLQDLGEWHSDQLFTASEIQAMADNGMVEFEPDDESYTIVDYDNETLVPAKERLNLPTVSTGIFGRYNAKRGSGRIFTWLEEGQDLEFTSRTGSIHQNVPVTFYLWSPWEAEVIPVSEQTIPPDNTWYNITLESEYTGFGGYHYFTWHDGGQRTHISNPNNFPMTLYVGLSGGRWDFHGDTDVYFYVPKGTEVVAGYCSHHSTTRIRMKSGTTVDPESWRNAEDNAGTFIIPVPEGQDGGLWRIDSSSGIDLNLFSVPPYVARNEQELMLPEEVIAQDEE